MLKPRRGGGGRSAGAGALGRIVAGLVAGGATIGIGQLALAFTSWAWLRLLIVFADVVPATVVGYSATHGLAQMAMSAPAWQSVFAVIGAIAIGATAFVCVSGMATSGPAGSGVVWT